jgi:hypothetical protein
MIEYLIDRGITDVLDQFKGAKPRERVRRFDDHVRGIGTVRPYIYGPVELLEFVQQTFDAVVLERQEFGPRSCHVEMQIGDSVLVIEAGDLPPNVSP